MKPFAFKKKTKTKDPADYASAYDYAVFLLSLSMRTVAEVKEKMGGRGYNEDVIVRVIDELLSHKYLDDRKYAEVFLENLKQYKNFGYYGIKKKFMEKKLPNELIEQALEKGLTKKDELQIAQRFLKKEGYVTEEKSAHDGEVHYKGYADQEGRQESQKMAQKLKSRGFRGDVIAQLLF